MTLGEMSCPTSDFSSDQNIDSIDQGAGKRIFFYLHQCLAPMFPVWFVCDPTPTGSVDLTSFTNPQGLLVSVQQPQDSMTARLWALACALPPKLKLESWISSNDEHILERSGQAGSSRFYLIESYSGKTAYLHSYDEFSSRWIVKRFSVLTSEALQQRKSEIGCSSVDSWLCWSHKSAVEEIRPATLAQRRQ